MPHLLSKSKYIRGLQCDRALWLDVYQPRLARYTAEQMRRFDRGRDFEYAFKSRFPDGIDLSAELKRNVDAYPARTAQLLDDANLSPLTFHLSPLTLFEAGFQYDDVLVLADVVCQRDDGTLDIYEVKSGTTLSETYKRDAALQHYVISHCRQINTFSIVYNGTQAASLRNSDDAVRRQAASLRDENEAPMPTDRGLAARVPDPSAGWQPAYQIVDLTEELAAEADTIARNIAVMKDILAHGEPATPTGQHCLEPYACPYQHYCAQGVRQMSLFE